MKEDTLKWERPLLRKKSCAPTGATSASTERTNTHYYFVAFDQPDILGKLVRFFLENPETFDLGPPWDPRTASFFRKNEDAADSRQLPRQRQRDSREVAARTS